MTIAYTYPPQDARYAHAMATINDPVPAGDLSLFAAGGPSFKDLIDTINPLQQLPVIGTLYRAITGDTISTAASLAGGALFGGPMGFMAAAINAGLEAATGGDVGTQVLAALGGSSAPTATTQHAAVQYMKAQNLG